MHASDDFIENIPYDALFISQSARLSRTPGSDDILAFAAVSGDVNPAHVDAEYADQTLFRGVIAHGMWGAALISRLLGTALPGPGTIYHAQTLAFLKPVRIGDELRVTATVTAKDDLQRQLMPGCEIKNQTGAVVPTMKGGLHTEVSLYDKVLLISDHELNIAPTLRDKAGIVRNTIDLAHALGNPEPKVAILAAVETVNPAMPSTLDAAALCMMAARGQIGGALLDGPLAFDSAIAPAAARANGKLP